MDKETVLHYRDYCEEIAEITRIVQDTVKGSSPEFPYTLHTIKLEGGRPRSQERLDWLRAQKAAVEEFLATLAWPKKKLVRAVMKYGTRWQLVQWELRSDKSPDALRMEFERIFEKFF